MSFVHLSIRKHLDSDSVDDLALARVLDWRYYLWLRMNLQELAFLAQRDNIATMAFISPDGFSSSVRKAFSTARSRSYIRSYSIITLCA